MIEIFGQEKLCRKISSLNLDNFPHTVMLVGQKGSGKSLVVTYISEHLGLDVVEVSDLTIDKLMSIQLDPRVKIYLFNDLSTKEQNQALKFFEEPVRKSFIILTTENKDSYLDTICNRCQIWNLDKYTDNQLREFCEQNDIKLLNDLIDIVETPGDIISLMKDVSSELFELSDKVLTQISKASYGNILNISKRFEDNPSLDIVLFIRLLERLAYKKYINNETKSFEIYCLTNSLLNDSKILHINKLQLLENYLFKLRMIYDT